MISMTWPEYLAGVCRINGRLTRLTLQEADVLLALVLSHPDRWSSVNSLIELVWPNNEPDWADNIIGTVVMRLKRHGVPIKGRIGGNGGYRIPSHARGRPELRMAA